MARRFLASFLAARESSVICFVCDLFVQAHVDRFNEEALQHEKNNH
ncbi:MAG: hypothetical protein H6Q30_2305 [Bacteroidetes bacterium]|jgi:hypothetical protein|nr:hypothetical protein [Bacteroidota bacterium]